MLLSNAISTYDATKHHYCKEPFQRYSVGSIRDGFGSSGRFSYPKGDSDTY